MATTSVANGVLDSRGYVGGDSRVSRTLAGSSAWQAVCEAWEAEGMTERCRAASRWVRKLLGRVRAEVGSVAFAVRDTVACAGRAVRGGVSAVLREFSPVLAADLGDRVEAVREVPVVVPPVAPVSLPDVASVVSPVYAAQAEAVVCEVHVLNWTPAGVGAATQAVVAERVAAEDVAGEVLYARKGTRYVPTAATRGAGVQLYRREVRGKAARYVAI